MDILLIIDVQNDFCENGSLAVPDGSSVIPIINSLRNKFQKFIFTMDWHSPHHVSFASSHERGQLFSTITVPKTGQQQVLWPSHCVQNTEGAKLHKDLIVHAEDLIVKKGINEDYDSYSGFGCEHDKSTLEGKLREIQVRRVFVCGLAYDYCVGSTAADSALLGWDTYVVTDACRSISENSSREMTERLLKHGVKFVTSQEV